MMTENQFTGIKSMLERVTAFDGFYKKKLAEYDVSAIQSKEDFEKLPFTNKEELREIYPLGLAAVPEEEIVRIHSSSGTTGKPTVVGYTKKDLDTWSTCVARLACAAGATPDDIAQIAFGYGLFTGALGLHYGLEKIGCAVIPMSSGNTAKQIMMMQDVGTTILSCTPSYAIHIAETIHEMGIPLSSLKLRAGTFGAEPWTEAMRKRLETLLNIDALDIYGLTEICGPGVAYECLEKQGMHVNEDQVIVEIIDPVTEKPLPYGEKGELVFTTITKEGMPMLRFRTHDLCQIDASPCACGRTFVRMKRIMGRTDDMLIIRGVNVFPSQIESVLVSIHGVAPHYMLVVDRQGATDTLEIQVEITEDVFADTVGQLETLEKQINERIKSVVGISANIKLVAPKSIPRSEGKAKRVIDKRKL